MPESARAPINWRIVVDANAKDEVGDVFLDAGADVVWVTREFDEGFPDDGIDAFARKQGRIIVGHDQRFLQSIQQRLFQFNIPATGESCSADVRNDSQIGCARCCLS